MIMKIILTPLFALTATLFLSCIQNIDEDILSRAHDDVAPLLTDVQPADDYAYGAFTQISGSVSDLDISGEEGTVKSLYCEIAGITDPDELEIEEDGSFNTGVLETNGDAYVGGITVTLTAEDWNGNISEKNLNYSKAAGEIRDFSVTRGNGQVTLEWESVAGVASYELTEYSYGLEGPVLNPSDEGSGETYTWEDLNNGCN